MKIRTYTKMIAATVLASSLLLGACGKKEESKTSASSSKTVQTSSSSKVASSSKISASPKVSNSTSSGGIVSQSGQTEAPASQQQSTVEAPQAQQTQPQQASGRQNTQSQATQPTQPAQASESNRQLQNKQAASNARYKGVLTMVDGNFSAAAGTWKDANGNTVTVSGNGQFTVQSADGKTANYSIASYSYTLDDGKYNAQLSGQGNANLQITTGADGSVTSVVVTQP